MLLWFRLNYVLACCKTREIVEMLKDNAVPFYAECINTSQSEVGENW